MIMKPYAKVKHAYHSKFVSVIHSKPHQNQKATDELERKSAPIIQAIVQCGYSPETTGLGRLTDMIFVNTL